MSNQVTGYDLTIPAAEFDLGAAIRFFKDWGKKWVFQLERGDATGYLHWQCRLSLHTKRRIGELLQLTKDILPAGHHWSITSSTCHAGCNFNYVMKADTRVDGPYKDSDYEEPPPLTRQLKSFLTEDFYPWQQTVFDSIAEADDRSIKLIIDTHGNAGKSIFCEFLEYKGLAFEIPPMRTMEDIMQCVMSIKDKKCYIVDMPRAMKKDKLADFYSGLEALKNGVAYDKRYSFKKKRMDRPQVVVFSNTEPDYDFMSMDRWQVWFMTQDKRLAAKDQFLPPQNYS